VELGGQAKEKDFDQHAHLNIKAFKKSTSYLILDNSIAQHVKELFNNIPSLAICHHMRRYIFTK